MKINFDTWNGNQNVEKTITSQGTPGMTQQSKTGAYALDISGMILDNDAYSEYGRSKKEVMQNFDVQFDNFSAQRDLMTVMSNIMSAEDFNKMMEEGFDPSKLEPEQVVTIVDHIKAEMAKSGKVITGYNDDMSNEALKEVLGSESLAREVKQTLQSADMPVNEKNVSAIKETLEKASQVTGLDDAGKKYMLENHLEPTVENIYKASFSAHGDGTKQSRGYFSQEMPGYYAKKAEVADLEDMVPQIEKSIEKMNLKHASKDKSMEQAKWLVEKGIPLTKQNMEKLDEVESLKFPLNEKEVIKAGVNALIKGNNPAEGSFITDQESIYQKANRYAEEVVYVSEEAVMETVSGDKEVTLQNLTEAQNNIDNGNIKEERMQELRAMVQRTGEMSVSYQGEVSVKYVHAARTLAEVRLKMTIDANIRLLKSDFSIDTMPLTELVEALKQQEQSLSVSFFGKENSGQVEEKAALFSDTRTLLEELPYMPAAVLGRMRATSQISLTVIHTEGASLKAQYQAAGVSYETLMTAPRADLGDSIKKAFGNVDDILTDMGRELSEDNRKAVRILGYNNTAVTKENLEAVKVRYLQVENVLKTMTPQKTLALIKEGVNPLTMNLNELEDYLNRMDRTPEEEATKYAGFLYELEKNGQISESERGAYIGIYRLFHQIEKSDGALIGSLMNQGAELSLGNLLTASRNRAAGNMDYVVDDEFGTLTDTIKKGVSISDQIEKGVAEAAQAHAVWRDLSVEKLQQANISETTTLSELKDSLSEAVNEQGKESNQERMQDAGEKWNAALNSHKEVYQLLENHGIMISTENMAAAKALSDEKGKWIKKINDYAERLDAGKKSTDAKVKEGVQAELLREKETIPEQFSNYEAAQKAMETWEKRVENILGETMFSLAESTTDMKEISLGFKQLSLMSALRKRENYEVPMEINGELTSVNLILVHDEEEKGTVSVSLETSEIGKAGAKFHISNNTVAGYFVADSEMGKEKIQQMSTVFFGKLEQMGLEIGETHYVNSHASGRKEFNFLTFSSENDDNNNKTVATAQLYDVARVFLSEMQGYFS